jgi:hypothetical protein
MHRRACRHANAFAILDGMGARVISSIVLVAALGVYGVARADEIRLKDGSKINGTIVGYESDSFKIETAYGFAMVRKDKVAEIIPTAPKPATAEKDPEPKIKKDVTEAPPPAKPVTSPAPAAPSTPKFAPAVASESVPAKPPAPKQVSATAPSPAPTAPPRAPAKKEEAHAEKSVAKPDCSAGATCDRETAVLAKPAVIPTLPSAPAEPPPIMEIVQGNKYTNYTYGFQIYKPPSWDLIAADRKALPNAVAALGTDDGTTLLIIGRAQTKNSLDAQASLTDKALTDVYENYRQISTRHTTIAKLPAVEGQARGTADGHDWSVVTITVLRNGDVFTLLGMTWADSDLIQVQENVLAKVVNSLAFSVQ